MQIIELLPITEWQEKEGKKILPSIRIYVGHLHVGTCYPAKNPTGDIPKYSFSSFCPDLCSGVDERFQTMDEIKMEVELSCKEFVKKFMKKYTTLKKKQVQ